MKNVLLGVSASVALYKSCDLASQLTQAGLAVRCILTENAAKLISPQLFEAVTGQPAHVSEWGKQRKGAMDHIDLARWGDALVVAPATADWMARTSHGFANDLLTTVQLAMEAEKPRLMCPAMNPTMFQAKPVQRNLAQLVEDGWQVVAPGEGNTACGERGQGRMAEPQEIADHILAWFA